MSRKSRTSPQGADRSDHWLRGGQAARSRAWAYEELLFGSTHGRHREELGDYRLARCDGFRVDSPSGYVGVVEGMRFGSRIDRPDLLEVRAGRLGRTLLLIPVEEVEDVSPDDECVVVRSAPDLHGAHVHELVDRVRRALNLL